MAAFLNTKNATIHAIGERVQLAQERCEQLIQKINRQQ